MQHFDHIILGTGQATATLLGKLIPTGASIAVIEKEKIGGSCVNYGCTPTKTMVASARAIHLAQKGDFYGFSTNAPFKVDYARIRARMNEVRNGSSNGLSTWIASTENVSLFRGEGYFTGPKTLSVNGQNLQGDKVYINVGTRPSAPPITGLDDVPWLDSARLFELEQLPAHLLILGGGYIGVEFAQVYRRFGSKVTIVQHGDQLMPREDADVASTIHNFLVEEGVEIVYNARANRVEQQAGGVAMVVKTNDGEKILQGSHLLIAAGRKPNADRLQLDKAGIATNERGYIEVDDHCRTNVEGVFALGDVNGKGAFTHTAVNDAEIALDCLFGGARTISERNTIYALFTDPPLGRVGMSEKEALATGKKVLVATRQMEEINRAKEMGETKGFAKLLVDAETDMVLGATILGVGGDEIINMFAAIMHSQIPCRDYRRVVLVHPTVSELMPWILDGIQEAKERDS